MPNTSAQFWSRLIATSICSWRRNATARCLVCFRDVSLVWGVIPFCLLSYFFLLHMQHCVSEDWGAMPCGPNFVMRWGFGLRAAAKFATATSFVLCMVSTLVSFCFEAVANSLGRSRLTRHVFSCCENWFNVPGKTIDSIDSHARLQFFLPGTCLQMLAVL